MKMYTEIKKILTIAVLLSFVVCMTADKNELKTEADINNVWMKSGNFTEPNGDNDFDVLIFTQQWPITTCYHWMEENKENKCNLPAKEEYWTIHGIWPTKMGEIGPNFCDKSAEFNFDDLKPIVQSLNNFWPDIEKGTNFDFLWKHEWLKHGTCAALLDSLNNEIKYFDQGLAWRAKYHISNILGNSGILPDSKYSIFNIQNSLKKVLRKNPSIHCYYDNHNDVSYLSEIRLCFNKSLILTDCDGVMGEEITSYHFSNGIVNTNCHISKDIYYPSTVPPQYQSKWRSNFIDLYKLLNFIMWITL